MFLNSRINQSVLTKKRASNYDDSPNRTPMHGFQNEPLIGESSVPRFHNQTICPPIVNIKASKEFDNYGLISKFTTNYSNTPNGA